MTSLVFPSIQRGVQIKKMLMQVRVHSQRFGARKETAPALLEGLAPSSVAHARSAEAVEGTIRLVAALPEGAIGHSLVDAGPDGACGRAFDAAVLVGFGDDAELLQEAVDIGALDLLQAAA